MLPKGKRDALRRGAVARVKQAAAVWWGAAVLAFLGSGCLRGGRSPETASHPVAEFPSRTDLAALPSLPPPLSAFTPDAEPVDHWTFEGSPQVAPSSDDAKEPLQRWANEVASAHEGHVRVSPALRCAARQVAQFYVQKGKTPTDSFERFNAGRCGASSAHTQPILFGGTASAGNTDQVLLEKAETSLREMLETSLSKGDHWLGTAMVRSGERFAVVAVIGDHQLDIEEAPRALDASRRVVVRGTFRTVVSGAHALINDGDYAAARCERDTRVALPAFAFSCPLAAGDRSAWLEITTQRQGHLLDDVAGELLVADGDLASLEYRTRSFGAPTPVTSANEFVSTVFEAVNRVRREGNLKPLVLSAAQTRENGRLAGTLIDSSLKDRPNEADQITLGLIAGWEIQGTIRNGSLMTAFVSPTRDVMDWLAFALEMPLGRSVLLDPEARQVAIGPALPADGTPALGAVVTTYALFESKHHEAESARVLAKVAAARKTLGRPALATLDDGHTLAAQGDLVLAGAEEPYDALDTTMRAVAQRTAGTVRGYVVETNDVDQVEIPEALLHAENGSLAVYVTHHRVSGAAWGQYVILYVWSYAPRAPGVES